MKIKLKSLSKLGKKITTAGKKLKQLRDKVTRKFPALKKLSQKLSGQLKLDKLLPKVLPKLLGKGGALKNPDVVGVLDQVLKGVQLPKDLEKVVRGVVDSGKPPVFDTRMGMDDRFRRPAPGLIATLGNDELKNLAELVAQRQAQLVAA